MTEVLYEMQTTRKKAIENGLQSIPEEILNLLMKKYEQIIRDGKEGDLILTNTKFKKNGELRKPVRTKTQNLLKRYELYQDDILRFTVDFEVPPTNNACLSLASRCPQFFQIHQLELFKASFLFKKLRIIF